MPSCQKMDCTSFSAPQPVWGNRLMNMHFNQSINFQSGLSSDAVATARKIAVATAPLRGYFTCNHGINVPLNKSTVISKMIFPTNRLAGNRKQNLTATKRKNLELSTMKCTGPILQLLQPVQSNRHMNMHLCSSDWPTLRSQHRRHYMYISRH